MPTYQKADKSVIDLADDILKKSSSPQHQLILDADVKFEILMVEPNYDDEGNPTGPAIRHNGAAAIGLTKVVPLVQRAAGAADVLILLDALRWGNSADGECRAILDHELTHILVVVKDGEIKRDSEKRPKIKLRHHDYEFGWFNEVAERNPRISIECQQANDIRVKSGQLYFPMFVKPGDEPCSVTIKTANQSTTLTKEQWDQAVKSQQPKAA